MTPMKSPTRVKFILSTLAGGSHMKMKLTESFKNSKTGRELTLTVNILDHLKSFDVFMKMLKKSSLS